MCDYVCVCEIQQQKRSVCGYFLNLSLLFRPLEALPTKVRPHTCLLFFLLRKQKTTDRPLPSTQLIFFRQIYPLAFQHSIATVRGKGGLVRKLLKKITIVPPPSSPSPPPTSSSKCDERKNCENSDQLDGAVGLFSQIFNEHS